MTNIKDHLRLMSINRLWLSWSNWQFGWEN